MKKWKKWYINIVIIIFAIECVVAFVFGCVSSLFTDEVAANIEVILRLIALLISVAAIAWFAILAISIMRRGIRNIRNCDDELFSKIDQYKKCWGEDRYYYIKQIQIINLYYAKDGNVDQLVRKNEIERLYARADFLMAQNALFDNMVTCFYSLVISIIASFICKMMECESVLLMFIWIIAIMFSFWGIFLLRYAEKGQAGSYRHYIDEYERKLLLEKIDDWEKKLIVTVDDEQILETKQVVINELIRVRERAKRKEREKIENDIKEVGKLNLLMGEYSPCYIQKIYVNGIECCMVYDREKGRENNYIGESNLINQDYSILYQILTKYDLISHYDAEDNKK